MFNYTTTDVNITSNISVEPDTIPQGKEKVNTFYDKLQEALDSGNRETYGSVSEEFEYHCINNTVLKTSYNTSGNISISCNIPAKTGIYPNYTSLLIYNKNLMPSDPTKAATSVEEAIMRILTQWIRSDDMLTYYYYTNEFKTFNNVPPINLYTELHKESSDIVLKWWNYGRLKWADDGNTTSESKGLRARQLCIAYVDKLNALFHEVISKDLTVADEDFRELLTNLFTNGKDVIELKDSTTGNINYETYRYYPWSAGALILPSLVNLIAHHTNTNLHALAYCGFVGKDARLYTNSKVRNEQELVNDNTKYRSTSKGELGTKEPYKSIRHDSVALFDINNGLGSNIGLTNYPFRPFNNSSDTTLTTPHVISNELLDIPKDKLLNDDVFKDSGQSNWRFPNKTKTFNGTRTTEPYEYHVEELDQQILGSIDSTEVEEINAQQPEKHLVRETRKCTIKVPIRFYCSTTSVRGKTNGTDGDAKSNTKTYPPGYDHQERKCINKKLGICWDYWYWSWTYAELTGDRTFTAYKVNYDIQTENNNVAKKFIDAVPHWIYEAEKEKDNGLANNSDPSLNVQWSDIKKWVNYPKSLSDYKASSFIGCSVGDLAVNANETRFAYTGDKWMNLDKGVNINVKNVRYTNNLSEINSKHLLSDSNIAVINTGDTWQKNEYNTFMTEYTNGFNNSEPKYYANVDVVYTIEYEKPLKHWAKLTGNYSVNPMPVYVPWTEWQKTSVRENTIRKFNQLITLSKMNKSLYVFTNQTFDFWMAMVRSQQGSQLILNAIRKFVKENINMVLLCKISMITEPYVKTFFHSSSVSKDVAFINFPFGPPLVYIPRTIIIPDKAYYPQTEIYEDTKYTKYDTKKSNVNIIRSISTGQKSTDSKNYLDALFTSMIEKARFYMGDAAFDNDTYFAIMIPAKGQNILDVISNSLAGLINQADLIWKCNWKDGKSIGYDTLKPKILMSFRAINKDSYDDHLAALRTSYKYITQVSVPIITFHKDDPTSSYIEFRVDTRSQTGDYTDNNEGDKDPQDTPDKLQEIIADKDAQDEQCDPDSGKSTECKKITESNGNETNNNESTTNDEHFRFNRWIGDKYIKESMNGEQSTDDPVAEITTDEVKVAVSGYSGKGKFPSKNILYIYVSNNGIQDFTSSAKVSKDETDTKASGIANTMLTINYRGLDSMYPCDSLRLRNVDLYAKLLKD